MATKKSSFAERASRAAWTTCGARVQHVSFPGGKARESIRLHLGDGRTVIATRRDKKESAEREVEVLQRLHRAGAPVPGVLAYDRDILLQEDVGDRRASAAVYGAAPDAVAGVLDAAIDSLARLQRAAEAASLADAVPQLGAEAEWRRAVAETPLRLAKAFELSEPVLDVDAVSAAIDIRQPSFIKWDARLGNAAIGTDGRVFWFDFEHCGARNALDDLAWLLGDEYLPDVPEIEARIFDARLDDFAPDGEDGEAARYLADFGTLHIAMRLALLLTRQAKVGWVDAKDGADRDKIGASRDLTAAMARRAARWAARSSTLATTQPTFSAIAATIETMP